MHITSFLSRAGDIQATVTLLDSGDYGVRIYDVDAGCALPVVISFAREADARAYALQCVTMPDDNELPF